MLSVEKNHLIATDFYRLTNSHETAKAKNSFCYIRFLSIVNQKVIIGNYRLIDWFSDIGFYRLECTSQADKGL